MVEIRSPADRPMRLPLPGGEEAPRARPPASRAFGARAAVGLVAALGTVLVPPPLEDAAAVWYEDDRRDVPQPEERSPSLAWDAAREAFFRPVGRLTHLGRLVRRVGTLFGGDHVPPAANVNALDEVPNSTWFTNRIGLYPTAPEKAAQGPGQGVGPDRSDPWTVISAKTEGLSTGFNIRDAKGERYLIKFDPPGLTGTTTAAGVITGRILHAAGYNVPDDNVVFFRREDVRVGDGVLLTEEDGTERSMSEADLDDLLARVDRPADGTWRAISSRFLPGVPVGPFEWVGRRKDDPNDRVSHENRRELRGLRIFSAWLCHYDTKQLNTLDTYVEEDERGFVRHHLIDFASTLGVGATGLSPQRCFEHDVDFVAMLGRAVSLGLHQDPWRRIQRPEGLDEVGYLESEEFDPRSFKPLQSNGAFANMTDRDAYWAAKILSAFRDDHLRAIVARGQYRNPGAAAWVARVLAERRDEIARVWFDRLPPLDFFTTAGSIVGFHDLGVERGIYPGRSARYRARIAAVTADRRTSEWGGWAELTDTRLDLANASSSDLLRRAPEDPFGFVAVELQVHRGGPVECCRDRLPVAGHESGRRGRSVTERSRRLQTYRRSGMNLTNAKRVWPWVLSVVIPIPAVAQEVPEARDLPIAGFAFDLDLSLPGSPEIIYDAFTGDISGWWDHTFSDAPRALYIEPTPGGAFMELFDESGDGVRHATVTAAKRGELLRL